MWSRGFLLLCLFLPLLVWGQQTFTRQDTLRGALSPLRTCFDVVFYDLNLRIKVDEQSLAGHNVVHFLATEDFSRLQLDLFENLSLDSIQDAAGQPLSWTREGNAFFVDFPSRISKGDTSLLTVYYHGSPRVAPNPPWDGGFVWAKDKYDRPWVGVSCEGLGASVWWPNKDHLSDEPDSMRIYIEANQELYAVANGNLRSILMRSDDYTGYEWFVSYPINNYNVTVNLAHYRHFSEVLSSTGGQDIPLDYYVLDYNLDKAQEHFAQVKPMLECFEELFGAYPFPNDGYALVETPYWGMEHQGAIAYGNNYRNLEEWDFDFIIIHESGHEYFGNSLSVKDHGEMWIHEAFTTYAEALYLECTQDLATATDYLMMQRENIRNQVPILGPLHVNYDRWPDADMYYKGTWLLHTLRNILDDDQAWKKIIYDFHDQHRLQSIDTEEVIAFFERRFGMKLSPIFYQYLRYTQIPVLEYRTEQKGNKTKVFYRWQANEAGFEMPVRVRLGKSDDWQRLSPKVGVWQSFSVPGTAGELLLDERGFYAGLQKYSE